LNSSANKYQRYCLSCISGSGQFIDDCGVCGGNNSICTGCDGVPNSGLVVDDCGVCDGNNECINLYDEDGVLDNLDACLDTPA